MLREDDFDVLEFDFEKLFEINGKIMIKEFYYKCGIGVFVVLLLLVFVVGFVWVLFFLFGLFIVLFLVEVN